MVVKNVFLLVLLLVQCGFSQSIEEKIYVATETFTANPTVLNLHKLIAFEKSIRPKNNAEFLATTILNCNKAYYQNRFGQTINAVASYEKSWLLYDKNKLKNYDIIEYCLKPLGNLYTQIGDFENAENIIKTYFFIANTTKNESQKISALQNLAIVYTASGQHSAAINLLENELKSAELSQTQRGTLLANLGANYLSIHNNVAAKMALKKSVKILKISSAQNEIVANSYLNLSHIYADENDFNQATLYFEKANKLFALQKNLSVRTNLKLFLEQAKFYFRQQKYSETQKKLNELLAILLPNDAEKYQIPKVKSLYAETILLEVFDLQAALFAINNNNEKALQWYNVAFEVEKLIQLTLVYENSKILAQISNRNRVEKCMALYENLYKKQAKAYYLENAFLLSEQNKTRVLKNTLVHNKESSDNEKEVQKQIQNQNTIIVAEQQKGSNANILIINKAIQKQNQLMLILKAKGKKTSIKNNVTKIDAVYKKLKNEDAILISYFYGNDKTYQFILENGALAMHSFSNSKAKITDFLDYFEDADKITNNVAGFAKSSKLLYDYLHIPTYKGVQNLIIIPDGILNFVPFEALLTKTSASKNFEKMPFLIRTFQISYQNSIDFFINDNAIKSNKSENNVLGVFPVFEKTDAELSFSGSEMKSIKLNFKGTYLEKNEATFENFKKLSANFSIIHLCTHATSGDVNTPASIKFIDRSVLYSELYNLDIRPKLLVLSACETGVGKLYKAEGAMSISRGFQMAGAKNVLFSLWKVNDYTTSVFMDSFYSSIKKGASYAAANRNAKLDFLLDKNISNTKKSPYYWCSMTYYGSLEATTSNDFLWYFAGLGLILILTFFLVVIRKSKRLRV